MALKNLYVSPKSLCDLYVTASKENKVVFFQFEYADFSGCVHFFRFRQQIPFLGKFSQKNPNCQSILKFGTWTNSNMQIQWRCSIFLLFIGITIFAQIWSN